MTSKPVIHPLAESHIRELRERWAVEPTLSEALWIVQLCERVINPFDGERLDLIGIPVRVGCSSEWLWPITIGASVWFQDLASLWWSASDERMFKALAFCLAKGRDKTALRECRTREGAEAAIKAWALSLTCTRQELEVAVDALLPTTTNTPQKADASKTDWAALVGEIEVITGIAADRWIWDISKDETVRAWHRCRLVLAARAGCGGADQADSPLDQALADLALAKDTIIKAHLPEAG